jgi:hypothetical protein
MVFWKRSIALSLRYAPNINVEAIPFKSESS